MKEFEVKNCGCNQDPCKTYGSEEEQKAQYENLKETTMRNPSMKSLLTEWRKLVNEHVTDEEHEHPHGDESDEDLNEAESIYPRPQHPMIAAGQAQAAEQAEIEDALIACFCDWSSDGATATMSFNDFMLEVAEKLGVSPESLAQSCEKIRTGAM